MTENNVQSAFPMLTRNRIVRSFLNENHLSSRNKTSSIEPKERDSSVLTMTVLLK